MSTTRDGVLTRGARGTGALVCLLLALLTAGWIIRDLTIAQHGADVWWTWLGEARRPREFTAWATSALDPLLTLGALVVALATVRTTVLSSVAAGALLSLAAATALLRLPLVWMLGAGWLQGLDSSLTARARLTALTQLALAVALIVVVVAGRRRGGRADRYARHAVRGLPQEASSAYGVVHAVPSGAGPERPGRPYKGAAITTGVLLGAAGFVVAGWEIYWQQRLDGDVYRKGLLGDASVFRALLQPPVHWQAAALALLALGAAAAVLRRAPWARPAAMTAAALLLVHGAVALVFAVRTGEFGRLGALPVPARLEAGTAAFVTAAALAALIAAARPGAPDASHPTDGVLAYGSAPGEARPPHAPPPPSRLPPGW
ncbi:hypothetical protein SAMN05428954_2487 [Streptomyces sp. 2112.3]|uniref:hypothetical protein n=1 Tax=Streptomyces sp. 2112.3 TaxID=1881023 RepID=UPI0008975F50|nr:hypothetical protein [Streptomyces sp. 2112.3]SEE38832.1 hypothetical protein SAMN05428954_2487 [Streptomyces sp. 2112.3]